jgi:alkylation response protein AidB-like acyl-CoA dehydrogenase
VGERLLSVKRDLARLNYGGLDVPCSLGGAGRSSLLQCYADLDLRDAAHLAHGRFPLLHARPPVRERWASPLLSNGELAAVFATEPTGGTALRQLRTKLRPRGRSGSWALDGVKQFVSRAAEASVVTVFARGPNGQLGAAVVPADRPGVAVVPLAPAGLGGWSWGRVHFDGVQVGEHEVLPDARAAWDEHFTYYRPMVAACVLGAAAAYWDVVAGFTRDRLSAGAVARVKDSALETLGEGEHAIRQAMLDVMHATLAVERCSPTAVIMSCSAKAGAVEAARRAVDDLVGLFGAAGFQADSRAAKIARDVATYRFADGDGSELQRPAGRALLSEATD